MPNANATMGSLTFKKSEVLEILRTNRAEHRKVFEDAMEGYRKQIVSRLEASIEEVKKATKTFGSGFKKGFFGNSSGTKVSRSASIFSKIVHLVP